MQVWGFYTINAEEPQHYSTLIRWWCVGNPCLQNVRLFWLQNCPEIILHKVCNSRERARHLRIREERTTLNNFWCIIIINEKKVQLVPKLQLVVWDQSKIFNGKLQMYFCNNSCCRLFWCAIMRQVFQRGQSCLTLSTLIWQELTYGRHSYANRSHRLLLDRMAFFRPRPKSGVLKLMERCLQSLDPFLNSITY